MSDSEQSKDKEYTLNTVPAIGFFTFMMLWTLNGDTGRDLNDVVVQWIEAKARQVELENRR